MPRSSQIARTRFFFFFFFHHKEGTKPFLRELRTIGFERAILRIRSFRGESRASFCLIISTRSFPSRLDAIQPIHRPIVLTVRRIAAHLSANQPVPSRLRSRNFREKLGNRVGTPGNGLLLSSGSVSIRHVFHRRSKHSENHGSKIGW